jgi:hypothetical protein
VGICKTFMRRFDPDPRLQNINNLEALQTGGLFQCSEKCSDYFLSLGRKHRRRVEDHRLGRDHGSLLQTNISFGQSALPINPLISTIRLEDLDDSR